MLDLHRIHVVVGLTPILHWNAGHRPEAGRDGDVCVPSTAEARLSETGGKTPTQPGTERQDHQRQQMVLRGAFNLGPLPVAQRTSDREPHPEKKTEASERDCQTTQILVGVH